MANDTTEFKPYIPANKITPKFTITSVITGIILAILTVCGVADKIDISRFIPAPVGTAGALILFAALIALMVKFAIPKKNEK